jgi:hypothetical protein
VLASSIFAAKPPATKKAAEAFEDDDIWG